AGASGRTCRPRWPPRDRSRTPAARRSSPLRRRGLRVAHAREAGLLLERLDPPADLGEQPDVGGNVARVLVDRALDLAVASPLAEDRKRVAAVDRALGDHAD